MIRIKCTGDFTNTQKFLTRASKMSVKDVLSRYGSMGVKALASATPTDTGLTANSWSYEISTGKDRSSITWTNSSMAGGIPVVILLQYGHGTNNGGYVSGVDFINPALRKIFDDMADAVWKEVLGR